MTQPHAEPPRPSPPHGGRGPAGLPLWTRDRFAVDAALGRRAPRNSPLWRTWDGVLCLALDLDDVAANLRGADALLPRLRRTGLLLAEQLSPPAPGTPDLALSLLDDPTALAAALRATAQTLVRLAVAPIARDADALLAEASAAVASVLPLLACWTGTLPAAPNLVPLLPPPGDDRS